MEMDRRVAFYETDMMGVVHHSNYLRYFEDARLEWLFQSGLLSDFDKADGLQFAVVEATAKFIKPAKYGDVVKVSMSVRKNRARLCFDYEINSQEGELICTGSTTHVTVDANLKVQKIPKAIADKLEKN